MDTDISNAIHHVGSVNKSLEKLKEKQADKRDKYGPSQITLDILKADMTKLYFYGSGITDDLDDDLRELNHYIKYVRPFDTQAGTLVEALRLTNQINDKLIEEQRKRKAAHMGGRRKRTHRKRKNRNRKRTHRR